MIPQCTPPAIIRTAEAVWPKNVHPNPKGTDLKASVRVVLASNGSVANASIEQTTGLPSFDAAAMNAVKAWAFQPPKPQCASVPYGIDVTFNKVPVPTPYNPCNHAAFAFDAFTPMFPQEARDQIPGPVHVIVIAEVDAAGQLQREWVHESSGNRVMDQVSLDAARKSAFAPKVVSCLPVSGGRYLFQVQFDPNL